MNIEAISGAVVELARASPTAALAIAFGLALGESLAIVSLFVPATFILVAFAGVLGAGGVSFWAAWLAASVGAALGYALSYWIGFHFKDEVPLLYPFKQNPHLLVRGREFTKRYGTLAVFAGHFFGPARASVPVVAGMLAMRQVPFQLANLPASFLWAALVLAPGQIGLPWLFGK